MWNTTKWTQEKYINECKKFHGDRYDYSKTVYINMTTDVIVICKIHGEFKQKARKHLSCGCSSCSGNKKKTKDVLIKDIHAIYGDNIDCSLIDYKNISTKIKLICKEHGDFYQYPGHLLQGHGCQKCSKMARMTEEEYIIQANIVHNNKYIYPQGEYKNKRTKMRIVCPKHGDFYQLPKHHLNGVGCKECNESRGEKKIKKILESLNINFEIEKRFKECRHKKPLPFDFYLPDKNICIEYDGIQHSIITIRFGGEEGLKTTIFRDEIKTNFCIENDIKLIRIKYNENIEEKLECLKIL